jgi:hypothetical protein
LRQLVRFALPATLEWFAVSAWAIVTEKLRRHGAAQRHLHPDVEHRQSRYLSTENSRVALMQIDPQTNSQRSRFGSTAGAFMGYTIAYGGGSVWLGGSAVVRINRRNKVSGADQVSEPAPVRERLARA